MWNDTDFQSDFCSIMGIILVAGNPISDATIDTLLSLPRPSRATISKLGCVLCWSDTEPVRILHPSFADFLTNRLRCDPNWHIDVPLHNHTLAVSCLNHLDSLKQNFCDLALTMEPVNEVLLEAISFAARSWIDHVCAITERADGVVDILEFFVFRHLLHWLEVMGILKTTWSIVSSLMCLIN
jgi:hypothetical protein